MSRKRIWGFVLLLALANGGFSPLAQAMSSVTEIEGGILDQAAPQPAALGPSNEIRPDHWSYKLFQRLASKVGLDREENGTQLDGISPLTRTEMALLTMDIASKLNQTSPSGQTNEEPITERDQAQFEILQEEFRAELKVLKARIEQVEDSVNSLAETMNVFDENGYVRVGKLGTAQLYGQFHVWDTFAFDDEQEEKNFRLRRANIGIRGQLTKDWQYNVMFDPVRSTNLLKDFWLEYTAIPHHSLRIGQFRPGLTYDASLRSSSRNYTAERTLIGRVANVREQGAALFGKWRYLDYQVGAYNGQGDNSLDDNNHLAFGGRITMRPLVDVMDEKQWGNFELGASVFDGQVGPDDDIEGIDERRDRYGFEARYHHPKFEINSEYLHLTDPGGVQGEGWYVEGVYKINPKWNLVARYDTLDPNNDVGDNTLAEYIAGFNYLWKDYNVRLGLYYIYLYDQADLNEGSSIRLLVQHTF